MLDQLTKKYVPADFVNGGYRDDDLLDYLVFLQMNDPLAGALNMAEDIIADLLAEVKALKAERDAALQQNAITILDSVSDIINGLSAGIAGDSGKKHFQLGINCPYCGSHFDNVKEAKEHDDMCEAHPAVIRAKKTEAERDVLAMRLAYDEDSPLACPERPCGMGWAPKEECFDCWLKYAQQQAEKKGV